MIRFKLSRSYRITPFVATIFILGACEFENASSLKEQITKSVDIGLNISNFQQGAFIQPPEIVDCETSAGTKTKCYKLVTSGGAAEREPGPFCPRNIYDSADSGGTWFNKIGSGKLEDLSGEFIFNLAAYYEDPNWKLYDPETKEVRYTATKAACLGAAKPNVEEQYKQNCIECLMSYLDEGFNRTYLIPTSPIPAESLQRARTAGIALDGAELSGPAPIHAILGSYTIAAFDDCGGHINEHQGYHYHSVNGCTEAPTHDDHAPLVGYAPDGYGIYALKDKHGNEATGLDECRGQTDSLRGYHYHVASPSENMILACLRGEYVNTGKGRPHPGGRPPRENMPPRE